MLVLKYPGSFRPRSLVKGVTGFTLIELMVAIAIVSILLGIGFPIYAEYLRKARRADAQGALYAFANAMEQHAARQPRYLRKWLEVIAWQVSQSLGDRALEFLNDEWRSTVWEDYRRGLRGKYPLARGSDTDAALRDFGDFFGPGGSVDRFFGEYLKDLVDTSHQIWRLPPNSPIHLSRESLVMLKRASVIQEAFFTTQDKVPLVKFALKPINMDVSIDDFYLDIDGQTFRYDHSATRVTSVTWPCSR